MLSLRRVLRFCHIAAAAILSGEGSTARTTNCGLNPIKRRRPLQEPALVMLKRERDPERLFNLFKANSHNRLVIENRFAFEDTVSRLAGACKFHYIEHLLEHQKALPQGRREGFVVRIIMLYGRAGMIEHAVKTFYDMHMFGCRRTVKSFNAALKVLTQTRDLAAIDSFFRDVPFKYGIELDVFSFNIVVKAFCVMDILDRAYLVMIEMEKAGTKPDVVTYTTLISAFYKNNRLEIGNGLWNHMVMRGCLPNLATFNARMQCLVNRRRSWQANSLMELMQHLGIDPDEITYNLVIKGFCQAGYIHMAKRVYSDLLGKGYKPNIKIYQTLIHYLIEGGEVKMAYALCKDCMKNNWFPNVDTIYKLLELLQKCQMFDQFNAIIMFVRRRVPPFPQDQLKAFQSISPRS